MPQIIFLPHAVFCPDGLVVEAEQDPAKAHPLTYARMGHDNLARLGLNAKVVAADAAEPDSWWDGQLFSGRPDWQTLLDYPTAELSEEEQAFIDGPTEQLCAMVSDWQIGQQLVVAGEGSGKALHLLGKGLDYVHIHRASPWLTAGYCKRPTGPFFGYIRSTTS